MQTPNFVSDKKGIKPDIEISKNPKDLMTNYDRQLNFIIQKLRAEK